MIYSLPVTLDHAVVKTPLRRGRSFKMSNGYDAKGVRVINIVGFRKGDFEKECPHCHAVYPASLFGLRYDAQHCKMRDQSYCPACRSGHGYRHT